MAGNIHSEFPELNRSLQPLNIEGAGRTTHPHCAQWSTFYCRYFGSCTGTTVNKIFSYFHILDWLISIWVWALRVPMHLGLINGPFVPHNLLSAQWSPVPCWSSRKPQDLTFNVLWVQEKGTQICILFFLSKVPANEPLQIPQQGPYGESCLFTRPLYIPIKLLTNISINK